MNNSRIMDKSCNFLVLLSFVFITPGILFAQNGNPSSNVIIINHPISVETNKTDVKITGLSDNFKKGKQIRKDVSKKGFVKLDDKEIKNIIENSQFVSVKAFNKSASSGGREGVWFKSVIYTSSWFQKRMSKGFSLTLNQEIIYGPAIASFSNGVSRGVVTLWRWIPDLTKPSKQYVFSELVTSSKLKNKRQWFVHNKRTKRNEGYVFQSFAFNLAVPEDGIDVGYADIQIHWSGENKDRLSNIQRFHPAKQNITVPVYESLRGARRTISENYTPKIREQVADKRIAQEGIWGMVPKAGLGNLISFVKTMGKIYELDEVFSNEKILGNKLTNKRSLNEIDIVKNGASGRSYLYTCRIPLKITNRDMRFELDARTIWGGGELKLVHRFSLNQSIAKKKNEYEPPKKPSNDNQNTSTNPKNTEASKLSVGTWAKYEMNMGRGRSQTMKIEVIDASDDSVTIKQTSGVGGQVEEQTKTLSLSEAKDGSFQSTPGGKSGNVIRERDLGTEKITVPAGRFNCTKKRKVTSSRIGNMKTTIYKSSEVPFNLVKNQIENPRFSYEMVLTDYEIK